MKKPKIKPEVVWMPWIERSGFVYELASLTRSFCIRRCEDKTNVKITSLQELGWRIVKVRINEVK
jgi:hypothetical protein